MQCNAMHSNRTLGLAVLAALCALACAGAVAGRSLQQCHRRLHALPRVLCIMNGRARDTQHAACNAQHAACPSQAHHVYIKNAAHAQRDTLLRGACADAAAIARGLAADFRRH